MIKPVVLPTVPYRDNWCMVKPLLVEAPGQIVPNVRISHPKTGQEAVRRTVIGVSKPIQGMGW